MATATEAPRKKGSGKALGKGEVDPGEQQEEVVDAPEQEAGDDNTPADPDEAAQAAENEKAAADQEAALEVLEPLAEPRRWVIGKPPEKGGTEDEYSIYVQRPLEYMSRLRFFSLVTKTVAEAIKAGGVISIGGNDLFGGSGNVRQRIQQIQASDFSDVSSFMGLAMQLIAYTPDFLLECYCLWLGVPAGEKAWAKMVMDQPKDWDNNKWGLSQKEHLEIVEVFIDQNYEDIRDFFAVELPRLGRRVQRNEELRQARESESAQSKQ